MGTGTAIGDGVRGSDGTTGGEMGTGRATGSVVGTIARDGGVGACSEGGVGVETGVGAKAGVRTGGGTGLLVGRFVGREGRTGNRLVGGIVKEVGSIGSESRPPSWPSRWTRGQQLTRCCHH
jgi:hypothetical protein